MLLGLFLLLGCEKDVSVTNEAISNNLDSILLENRTIPCNTNVFCSGLPKFWEVTMTIQGCRVKATYKVVECPNVTKFSDIKFQIISGCDTRLNLDYLANRDNHFEVNSALNEFHKLILDRIEAIYIAKKPANSSHHNIQWLEASCYKFMICNYYDVNDESWDIITPLKCGESCCERVIQYIRIPGNKWLKGPTVVTGDNICTYVPIVIPDVECSSQSGTILDFCNVACAGL